MNKQEEFYEIHRVPTWDNILKIVEDWGCDGSQTLSIHYCTNWSEHFYKIAYGLLNDKKFYHVKLTEVISDETYWFMKLGNKVYFSFGDGSNRNII